VNCVAPVPVWTPLVAQSFDREKLKELGKNYPMERPAQPAELAPAARLPNCSRRTVARKRGSEARPPRFF